LRADAPAFVPSATAKVRLDCCESYFVTEHEGDRLIQKLADRMASATSTPVPQKPVVRAPQPSAVARTSLLAAGLFCPACVQGDTCAFHVPASDLDTSRSRPPPRQWLVTANDENGVVTSRNENVCKQSRVESAALLWLENGAFGCNSFAGDDTCTEASTVGPLSLECDEESETSMASATVQAADFPLPYKSAVWNTGSTL
jgi:hypothetical protein